MTGPHAGGRRRRIEWSCVLLAALPAIVIYWLTAYRTINWWDSAEYALSAITLGVPSPPGSLVAVLVGWLVTRLPLGMRDVLVLNLLAGVVAAVTVAMVARVALRLTERSPEEESSRVGLLLAVAAALGTLPLAFGQTLWTYAIQYTPYVFTALVTILILHCLLRWWEGADDRRAVRWLFLAALLLGLDVSVHRTNAVLVPGIAAWMLLRAPRTLLIPRAWLAGVGGLLVGLLPQLLLIPIAAKGALWVSGNPDTLAGLWDYLSLAQRGGGFLLDLFPRNAPFFGVQVMDLVHAFGNSFARVGGALKVVGAVPLVLGLVGLWSLWRRERKLALGLVALFLLSTVTTILYFNIPENYFRSLHRHYLPCLVLFAVLASHGAGVVVRDVLRARVPRTAVGLGATLLLLVVVPIAQVAGSYKRLDGSRSSFAAGFAHNLLDALPPNAILFTSGDNDTFPLWYLQGAEGVRTDVGVVNIPLTNADWFVDDALRDKHGVAFTPLDTAVEFGLIPWEEDTVAVAVGPDPSVFALPDTVAMPDSIRFVVAPTAGGQLLAQDQVALRIIEANVGRRPIFVAITAATRLPWLSDYLRPEGMVQRLVPVRNPPVDAELLRRNLFDAYSYEGYADPSVALEQVTRTMGSLYYLAFRTLVDGATAAGDGTRCLAAVAFLATRLPPPRLELPPTFVDNLDRSCRAVQDAGAREP